MYMVTILLRRQNRLTRKSSIVFAKTDDIFLGWNFSLEMVDQFFFGPSDRIIPYAEPSHSLDGEAEAYIEANGATLGDSSLPDPFPFYVFSLFLLLLSRPTHNLHVNFETIRREPSLSFLPFFPGTITFFVYRLFFEEFYSREESKKRNYLNSPSIMQVG